MPVVVADLSKLDAITPASLKSIGYTYHEDTDKWSIADGAADYFFTGHQVPAFALPGTLRVLVYPAAWQELQLRTDIDPASFYPIYEDSGFVQAEYRHPSLNFVMLDADMESQPWLMQLANDPSVVLCFSSRAKNAMQTVRSLFIYIEEQGIHNPVVLITDSTGHSPDEHLIHFATETGALLLDGMGDGICLGYSSGATMSNLQTTGRTYLQVNDIYQFTNNTAFSILQATRTRISKTEYISCPSCGRTLFDLQETTARIRAVTHHLKGVKIAIMGCIVNGPGEMADADFGYVGSGPGKITLYKGKEVVKRNVNSEVAVEELIMLLKENDAWVEK